MCGTITPDPTDPTQCTYTATAPGTGYIVCWEGPPFTGLDGSTSITIQQGTGPVLTRIEVAPPTVTVNFGGTQQFTATGYDQNDNPMDPPITPIWSASGGTINTSGLYTGTEQGTHTITASVDGSPVTGTASVTVNPPDQQLTRIEVAPPTVTVNFGATQQFTATGYDQNDNPMDPPITPIWSASGGNFNTSAAQQALYTAGNLPGHYEVVAAVGEIEGCAQVEITGDPPPDLASGQSYEHTFPTPGTYPYYNRHRPSLRGTVEVSPTPQALHTLDVTDVSITEAGFNPPSVTIGTSDAVRWTNNGTDIYTIRGGVPYEIYLPRVLK